jgi:hypothetical protein
MARIINQIKRSPGAGRVRRRDGLCGSLKGARVVLEHPSVLKRRNYIFLLSHVRGYTTLLSHILGSHHEISGYAETWRSYRTARDLLKLRCAVCSHGNYKPNCTYFLDKMLHNSLQISDSILTRTDIDYIFMVRKPLPTIKSMVAFYRKCIEQGGPIQGSTLPSTVEDAVVHYLNRLSFLVGVSTRLRRRSKRAIVVRAEDLISRPFSVLSELQTFLHLRSALDEQYSLFDRTGKVNFGDTSDFIRLGKIERERPAYAEISIPGELAAKADREYERCMSALTHSFLLAMPAKDLDAASMASEP